MFSACDWKNQEPWSEGSFWQTNGKHTMEDGADSAPPMAICFTNHQQWSWSEGSCLLEEISGTQSNPVKPEQLLLGFIVKEKVYDSVKFAFIMEGYGKKLQFYSINRQSHFDGTN